jgi:acyl-coenzyme A thioesterase PaaI-like protein
MRLLAMESEQFADGDVRGWLPVTPLITGPDGGPRIGAVAMLVDALGGMRAITAAAPDWAFTADMSLHLLPTGPIDHLRADIRVLRRGRRTLVLEAELTTHDDRPAGLAMLTFAVVPRPDHLVNIVIDFSPGRRIMSSLDADQIPPGRYYEELGFIEQGTGIVGVELHPEVENTVGALHGAVHTALIDEAAVSIGRSLLGPTATTTDVHLAFMELGVTGPMRAEARLVGRPDPAGDRITAVVQVFDGNDRVCSHATVEVRAR